MFYVYAGGKLIFQPPSYNLMLLKPKLTLEMGKSGSFEFVIPPTHKYFNSLQPLLTLIQVELDDTEIFRGRVLTNKRLFDGTRQVYCEGDLAFLVDSVQSSERFYGKTHDLFRRIVNKHNARVEDYKRFSVGTIGIENRDILVTGSAESNGDYEQIAVNASSSNYSNTFDYIEDTLIDNCGGYLRTRHDGDITYLDLVLEYGNTATQEIEFGKNLLDLTEEVSSEDVFSVLVPLGDDGLTIASVNGGSDELVDNTALQMYGRIVKSHSFESVTDPSTLLENGRKYLATHVNTPVTITAKAVDLHLIDKNIYSIQVGDKVRVRSAPHDIVEYLICRKIEYDFENPENNSYTFGNEQQSLTESYRKNQKATTHATTAAHSAAKASGAVGRASKSDAVEEVKEQGDELYDAWVNVDPSAGSVKIGALFRRMKDTINVLETQVGINIDAGPEGGNVDINNLMTQVDDLTNETKEIGAHILTATDDTKALMEFKTAYTSKVDNLQTSHSALLQLVSDIDESVIKLEADRVNIDSIQTSINATNQKLAGVDKANANALVQISSLFKEVDNHSKELSSASADISALTTQVESLLKFKASYTTPDPDKDGDVKTRIAQLELIANEHGTEINLKADTVTIDAKIFQLRDDMTIRLSSIETTLANIDTLISNKIKSVITETAILKVGSLSAQNSITVNLTNIDGYIKAPKIIASKSMTLDNSSVVNMRILGETLSNYVTKTALDKEGYIKSIPSNLSVKSVSLDPDITKGYIKFGSKTLRVGTAGDLVFNSYQLATKSWVNEQLKEYAKKTHTHAFSASTTVNVANDHKHSTSLTFKAGQATGYMTNSSSVMRRVEVSGTTKAAT